MPRDALLAACFAQGQASAREYLANGGERPRCPLRLSSSSPTQRAMASAWAAGFTSVEKPDLAAIDDTPPETFPPYRYPMGG